MTNEENVNLFLTGAISKKTYDAITALIAERDAERLRAEKNGPCINVWSECDCSECIARAALA